MVFWLTAAAVGVAAAGLQYGRPSGMGWLAALLRVLSVALLVALCLDAPAGRGSQARALAALDVSASWRRGQDSAAYRTALSELGRASGDSVLLIGDSLRAGPPPAVPRDARSRVRPAVERALAAGRPLTLITDGEIDDPEALTELPAGSRVVVVAHPPSRDAGLTALDAPRAAVAGDTIELRATLVAGPGGSGAGHVAFSVGSSPPAPASIIAADPLPKGAERSVTARVPVPAGDGPRVLRAVWTGDGDTEVRDDTLSAAIDVSPAAGAVFVSTSPDEDARYALSVLRDALTLPTRGFFRVAPGQWRVDGTLDHVTEADVRQAVASAPVVVLDGDTAVFGAPRAASRGSLALLAPPAPTSDEEWYATGAPPSPVAGTLGGVTWDSLPPIDVAPENAVGDWQGLEAKRGRRYDRRVVVAGSTTEGRRVVTVNAGGLWRWRFRGGASADAYTALWGGIFDWLAAERRDQRAAVPADALVREGDPIRWRHGSGPDTSVTVVLTLRGGSGPPDSLRLRFPPGAATTETGPLAAGVYDVRTTGGPALLVVNASREWLPRAPSVRTGQVGGVVLAGAAPRLRALGWIYLLLVAALCAEWLWRRRAGLR
jgi:hypothetical protein